MNRSTLIVALGIAVGAIAGWLYWKYLGCQGSCLITSKPLNSSVYGAVLGGVVFNMISGLFKTYKIGRKNQ